MPKSLGIEPSTDLILPLPALFHLLCLTPKLSVIPNYGDMVPSKMEVELIKNTISVLASPSNQMSIPFINQCLPISLMIEKIFKFLFNDLCCLVKFINYLTRLSDSPSRSKQSFAISSPF